MKLTKAQADALAKLKSMDFTELRRTQFGNIETGLNVTTLRGLRQKGLISFTGVYLGGIVTPDLRLS